MWPSVADQDEEGCQSALTAPSLKHVTEMLALVYQVLSSCVTLPVPNILTVTS